MRLPICLVQTFVIDFDFMTFSLLSLHKNILDFQTLIFQEKKKVTENVCMSVKKAVYYARLLFIRTVASSARYSVKLAR